MADITDENTQQLIRTIVREETATLRDDLRVIVREETADMRDDIATLKQVQGQQSIVLRTIQVDVGSLKTSYRKQASETRKLGILFEDLEDRLQASSEVK